MREVPTAGLSATAYCWSIPDGYLKILHQWPDQNSPLSRLLSADSVEKLDGSSEGTIRTGKRTNEEA